MSHESHKVAPHKGEKTPTGSTYGGGRGDDLKADTSPLPPGGQVGMPPPTNDK